MIEKSYTDFLNDLGERESGGDYSIENTIGYLGKYQWGEAMLSDLGYYTEKPNKINYNNNYEGEWTGKDGIYSKEDFLNNPVVQEKAIREEMEYLNRLMEHFGYDEYIGKNINGIEITRSGILAGAHLKGYGKGGIIDFLKKGLDGTDAYNTKISEYIEKFGDYKTPFNTEKENNDINKKNPKIDGISEYFIWHSEEGSNTCQDCSSRDGKIFQYGIDEEPPLHPNCNCWIEEIDNSHNQKNYSFELSEIKSKLIASEIDRLFYEIKILLK